MDKLAIGVDIGASKLAFVLVSEEGDVRSMHQVPTRPGRGARAVLDDIANGIRQLLPVAQGTLLGVGIGTPGLVIPEEGIVQEAVNLGWKEVHIVDELQTRLGMNLPIEVRKDADANLLGEYYFGSGRGCQDFIYLCVGSGLGGAIMANGRLVSGVKNSSLGIGHIYLYPGGRKCACGLVGCAETVISGPGLVAETRRLLADNREPSGLNLDGALAPPAILAAARSGDPLANQALSILAEGLGRVMALSISMLNPALVVLGGGLILAGYDLLVEGAISVMKQHALSLTYVDLRVEKASVQSSAIGAACLVWYLNHVEIK